MISRDMRQQFTGINECRVTAPCWQTTPISSRPSTRYCTCAYDKPASPDSCRHTDLRPDAPRAAFQAAICREAFLNYAKGLHSVYTSKKLSSFMHSKPPIAPSHLSWRTSPAYRHICRFRGDLLDGPVFVFCFTLLDEIAFSAKRAESITTGISYFFAMCTSLLSLPVKPADRLRSYWCGCNDIRHVIRTNFFNTAF